MWRNDWYFLYRLQNEYHRELIQEAEKSRLIKIAKGIQVKRPPLYAQPLLWLGHRMMALGYNLLKRYGTVSAEYPTCTLPITK